MTVGEKKLRSELRKAFAKYWFSEGCSCCSDEKEHEETERGVNGFGSSGVK